MTQIFDGPIFFNVTSETWVEEAARCREKGHQVITNHTILQSPLTLASEKQLRVFINYVEKTVPVMAETQPFSGQTAPMTPYGVALVAFAEFIVMIFLSTLLVFPPQRPRPISPGCAMCRDLTTTVSTRCLPTTFTCTTIIVERNRCIGNRRFCFSGSGENC